MNGRDYLWAVVFGVLLFVGTVEMALTVIP